MPSRLNLKLSETIRQRAARVVLYELKDPRMGFVTITHVKLAPDFSTCTIFWSVIGGPGERSKTAHALEHARLFIQHRVADGLRLRNAPQVSFEFDESVEGAIRMGGLLRRLKESRGDEPEEGTGEGAADSGTDSTSDAANDPLSDAESESEDEASDDLAEEPADAEDPDEDDADVDDPDEEMPGKRHAR